MQSSNISRLRERGMTLLEIMIVLAIIGSLMALLIPQVTARLKSAKIKQTKVTMGQIIQALNNYQIDCGKYPTSMDFLSKADPECPNWGPDPYMKHVPKDAWNKDFTYEINGSNFHLTSAGDGKLIDSEEMQ